MVLAGGFAMARAQSWEVSDAFWERVAPLVPRQERAADKNYQRKAGGGRKPLDPRRVFEAIVYVARTGCHWKALPKHFGSASSIHKYFQAWEDAGFFVNLWRAGLAEYDDLEGIQWEWQAIDGAHMKAPLGRDETGPSPVDRGKKRQQAPSVGRRTWRPALDRRLRR
jgi:transposase